MAIGLTIIVPVYNEERRLPRLLAFADNGAEEALLPAGLELEEIIVVDDGSTDGTRAVLEASRSTPGLRMLRHESNRGKGAAVRTGMLAARGTLALGMDVDLSTPPSEVASLAAAIERGADIAAGSRGLPDSDIVVHQPVYRELMGKTFNVLLRIATGLKLRDTQCGFKLFRLETTRRLFEEQQIDGFAFDAEILVRARGHGLTVDEIPVRWANDPVTSVNIVGASARMLMDLLRIAWLARVVLPRESRARLAAARRPT